MPELHGGNLDAAARRLGCRPGQLLDASASLVPFAPPRLLRRALRQAALKPYPDRSYQALRTVIATRHGLDPASVLPGNGAAELFTWAARDAAAAGPSLLPQPGFADYRRALCCWEASVESWPLRLDWCDAASVILPPLPPADLGSAQAVWITNPHNPTGQLWSRASLEALLQRFALVICDEAFLPLVPGGEAQSLVPLLADHPNLVVIRSLTKLFAIAGLRLGYALGDPQRLRRWAAWRDPWPVNSLAAAAGETLMGQPHLYDHWCARVQAWVAAEGAWLRQQLQAIPGLQPMPSAANYLLVRGERGAQPSSLDSLRQRLEQGHRILVRDCRSFEGLGDTWLRIGYQSRWNNGRIIRALRQALVC